MEHRCENQSYDQDESQPMMREFHGAHAVCEHDKDSAQLWLTVRDEYRLRVQFCPFCGVAAGY